MLLLGTPADVFLIKINDPFVVGSAVSGAAAASPWEETPHQAASP